MGETVKVISHHSIIPLFLGICYRRVVMRLGGPVHEKFDTPEEWIQAVIALGYRAAYCPLGPDASEEQVKAYKAAAEKADIMIAEVGAWVNNPISPDQEERKAGRENCKKALALADAIGARVCVNVAGSRGTRWAGLDPLNLTDETFGMIVEAVREIVDDVKPQCSCYTLETMPWMYPDSAGSYLALVKAIDRKGFAVHFDPVNLICSPKRYYTNGDLIKDFIKKLGPNIKSVHAKDILLADKLTTHLDEVCPGQGNLDYPVLLNEISNLADDVPVMLEHLPGPDEYAKAAEHIRITAKQEGITL
jgi:sugar phosphate isomerase/epimerase